MTILKTLVVSFSTLIFCFWVPASYAQVYKCVVNGKTVYSDAQCAYEAQTVNINPNQNMVSGGQSSIKSSSQSDSADAKCAELLDEITYQSGHINKSSYSGYYDSLSNVKALKYKYEALCMSAEQRSIKNEKSETDLSVATKEGRSNRKVGGSVIYSDGSSSRRIGNTTIHSNGTSSQHVGNLTLNSDGSSSRRVGNMTMHSDGSSSRRVGNTIIKSNGKSCQILGNQTICN